MTDVTLAEAHELFRNALRSWQPGQMVVLQFPGCTNQELEDELGPIYLQEPLRHGRTAVFCNGSVCIMDTSLAKVAARRE